MAPGLSAAPDPAARSAKARFNRVAVARAAMRARFEIVACGERDPEFLRAAGEEALREIARLDADLSPFRPDSALARINREAGRRPVAVDGVVWDFLEAADRLVAATGGAFDPTIGALTAPLRRGRRPPAPATRARVGFPRVVELDRVRRRVRLAVPGARLDPGAIGKGFALDRAAAVLRDAGVESALLQGGTSSVYGLGAPPGAAAWQVAIADPARPSRRLARVLLRDRALGVSAARARLFGRHPHVVDPRTLRPAGARLLAAAACDTAAGADAISTALLVLGDAEAEQVLARFPGASLLVVRR